MKYYLAALVLLLTAGLLVANAPTIVEAQSGPAFQNLGNSRDIEVILYEYGFEDGLDGWTTLDGTAPTDWNEEWHLSVEGAYEGMSWWMGDEDIGGYDSHRYIVMDTPEISLPAGSPALTFKLDWHVEDPGGEPAGYSGWDGCNVRISTDGGSSWDVIEGAPAYTNASLYSFGFEFGEGEGIAGWCADSGGWVDANFDLSAYAGQDVKIRWAFCSDPAYSTIDEPAMFGMRVDNINIADVFYSDGEGAAGDDQMVSGYGGEASGDFWVLNTTNAHSGSNCMNCPIEPSLMNFLITPELELPSGEDVDILFSYWVYCDMLDSDGDGDNSLEDYYRVYIKGAAEPGWTQLHYAYNGNILISDWMLIDQEFALANFGWHNGTCDLTPWAGQTVKLRFEAITDDNDDGGTGAGLFIDDFVLYSLVPTGPAPENLMVETQLSNDVLVTWDAISIGGEEGWIGWDDGVYADALGLNQASQWDVASRFTADDIMPYVGGQLTKVKFYPAEPTTNFTVRVWTGVMAANLVAQVQVDNPVIDAWNEIILPNPVDIVMGEELWIGYQNDQTVANTYPAGMDAGPSVAGLWANLGTGWQDLSGDFSNNWLIQGYVDAADGRTFTFTNNRDRDLEGYNVWRGTVSGGPYDMIATLGTEDEPEYLDTDPVGGEFNYYVVTAIWDGNDSPYSNEGYDYVLDEDSGLLYYDDGTAESNYSVGVGKNMAVRFSPTYVNGTVTLTHAKVYVVQVNTGLTIIKAWEDNGGVPGNVLFQYPFNGDMHVGWNTIPIPVSNQQDFTAGDFYLGIFEMNNLSQIGFDEDTSGRTYNDISGSWVAETEGNLMVRAILFNEPNADSNDDSVPANRVSINNYPNPFNPLTNIQLNMPAAGQATISVYNLKGQLVKTVLNDQVEAGSHVYTWDGTDSNDKAVDSGLYLYKLDTGSTSIAKKMVLLK